MLRGLHVLLLALLGGVPLRDAIEAACYERQRPSVPRDEALGPPARVICRKVDEVVAKVERQMGRRP